MPDSQQITDSGARTVNGWSVEQVAALARTSAKEVAAYEAGQRRPDRSPILDKAYAAFRASARAHALASTIASEAVYREAIVAAALES